MEELKYGREGYSVKLMQYALRRAGFDPGSLDGIYGRRTAKALQPFQRRQGLAGDGVTGKLTWAALYPYITGYALHRLAAKDGCRDVRDKETETFILDLPVVTDWIPCSYLLTRLMLQGLVMRYPFVRVYEIGRSVMGRPILAAYMGRGRRRAGYAAAHGADEWVSVTVLLRFLEEYAAAYANGGSLMGAPARELFEGTTLHVVPLVNPDGVDLVTGALSPLDSFHVQAQALAAYYPHVPFPTGWRSNISGVDLSLQYPTGWEQARRVRFRQGWTRPGPRNFAGSEPLIAPESRAMARWTRDHDFDLVLCFDKGYGDWFAKTWDRLSIAAEVGPEEHPEEAFDRVYEKELPILVRGLTLSP